MCVIDNIILRSETPDEEIVAKLRNGERLESNDNDNVEEQLPLPDNKEALETLKKL